MCTLCFGKIIIAENLQMGGKIYTFSLHFIAIVIREREREREATLHDLGNTQSRPYRHITGWEIILYP